MTADKRNLILCGFMATGKSSVGKQLAQLVGYDFVDMDASIEAEEGISIPQIFAQQGEAAFRALESKMVERISNRQRCVIATGGGTIVNPLNLAKLKSCGALVNLYADIDTILARAGSGEDRPMLQQGDRRERIRSLMEQRAPAYAQADLTVDTSSLTVEDVAREIVDRLRDRLLAP
jgi:shikimate kinase